MKLYKAITLFLGKDLNEEVILRYFLAEDDEAAFEFINTTYVYSEWEEHARMSRDEIIASRGDFDDEYLGEFYDQKYGWELVGDVSPDEIATLTRLGILLS